MAISIDWQTKVISVPQSFLEALGGDSYRLDTNAFRIALRHIEDDEAGIAFPKTHSHNTKVLLGGIEYARIIEILAPYTVTFEDTGTPYKVFLAGSNNNILDRTNLNNVSVAPNNSAGLVQTAEIEFGAFGGGVWVDQVNGVLGTTYPAGTARVPCKTIPDARTIMGVRGFSTMFVVGNLTLGAGDDVDGISIMGSNPTRTVITVQDAASTIGTEFQECALTGILDGQSIVRTGVAVALNYVNGFIFRCVLSNGTITLGGSNTAYFLDCYSGVPGGGPGNTPIIDMGGDGPPLVMRGYAGGLKLVNKTGSADASLDFLSGQLVIDSSCVAGSVTVRGNAKVVDENGNHLLSGTHFGGLTLKNEATFGDHIHDLWQIMGLDKANPMTVTPTSRQAGLVVQDITGDGETSTTVTRQ